MTNSRVSLRLLLSTVPLIAVCGAGLAGAMPVVLAPALPFGNQPGITTPHQPGVTITPLPPMMHAHLPPIEPPAPASDYGRLRPLPMPRYAAPVDPGRLHPPVPVPPVAPIEPPANMLRIGGLLTPAPRFLSRPMVDRINVAAAGVEAQLSTFSRSIGVQPSRSDRIAAAAVAGGAVGLVGAGLAGAVAGGGVGVAGGAALGAGVGAAVALAPMGLGAPALAHAAGAGAVIGGLLGGALGAPVVAIPAALAGGVAGTLIGATIGSATL